MGILQKKLTDINFKDYTLGIYKDNSFFECKEYFKRNAVKVQIKKDYKEKFIKKLCPLVLRKISKNKYRELFIVGKSEYLIIEYVVDSHVLTPKVILKDFCSDDTRLYYIDTKKNVIKKSSASNFNTKRGYFTLEFEEYLSVYYENKIGNIKKKTADFVFNKKENVQYKDLFNDIKQILNMSFFRNPRFIDEINKESLSSKYLSKAYNSEDVALFYNKFETNAMKGMSIYLIENRTEEGFLLSSEIFSNLLIPPNVRGMILPLNPKYGFTIVPTEYYEEQNKKYSNESYQAIEDLGTLHSINRRIYKDCKNLGIEVLGRKEDLEKILNNYK